MSRADALKFTMQKRRAYFPAITVLEMNSSPLFSTAASRRRSTRSDNSPSVQTPDRHEVLEERRERHDAEVVRDRLQLGMVRCQVVQVPSQSDVVLNGCVANAKVVARFSISNITRTRINSGFRAKTLRTVRVWF